MAVARLRIFTKMCNRCHGLHPVNLETCEIPLLPPPLGDEAKPAEGQEQGNRSHNPCPGPSHADRQPLLAVEEGAVRRVQKERTIGLHRPPPTMRSFTERHFHSADLIRLCSASSRTFSPTAPAHLCRIT